MGILWLLAAPFSVEIDASALSRKSGSGWELALTGHTQGLPDGAIVTMRFSRIENQVHGKDCSLRTVPNEHSWIRKAYVERNSFTHREGVDGIGEFQIEFCFAPEDQEANEIRKSMGLDYRPYKISHLYRVGRPSESSDQLRRDYEVLLAQIEEATQVVGEKKELDRLIQKVQESKTILSGSARALERLLMNSYPSEESVPPEQGGEHRNGVGVGRMVPESGEGFPLLRAIAGREAALQIFRDARFLREEAEEAFRSKNQRKPIWEKDLAVLKKSWKEIGIEQESLSKYILAVEQYARSVETPPTWEEEWEREVERNLRGVP